VIHSRGTVLLLAGISLIFGSWIVGSATFHRHPHPSELPSTDPGTAIFYLDEMTDALRTPIQKAIGWSAFIGFVLFASGLVSRFGRGVERPGKQRS
jgi:hypothetical protein